MKLDGTQGAVYATDGNDHPCKGSAEKTTDHPEGGLDTEVGTTILVPDEFRVIGKEDW